MVDFKKETLKINGVDTVVYTAGKGEPLLFLHGAGTFHGFEFAKPWADKFRVIHPYHPGLGESGDDPAMDTFHDYVMHYVEPARRARHRQGPSRRLFARRLLAAQFASQQRHRVKTLTLVAPAGMRSKEHPTLDVLATAAASKIVGHAGLEFRCAQALAADRAGPRFMGARYREGDDARAAVVGKALGPEVPALSPSHDVPTLIVWGDEDSLVPRQHAELWKKALAESRRSRFSRAPAISCSTRSRRRPTPSPLSRRPPDA